MRYFFVTHGMVRLLCLSNGATHSSYSSSGIHQRTRSDRIAVQALRLDRTVLSTHEVPTLHHARFGTDVLLQLTSDSGIQYWDVNSDEPQRLLSDMPDVHLNLLNEACHS